MSGAAARVLDSTCPQCGDAKPQRYLLCWRCHISELQAQAYTTGFAQGFEKAKAETPAPLDAARIRQLLQCCHPDRHGNSLIANDCTQWLLKQRELLEAHSP